MRRLEVSAALVYTIRGAMRIYYSCLLVAYILSILVTALLLLIYHYGQIERTFVNVHTRLILC
jgi:hypothetical protein